MSRLASLARRVKATGAAKTARLRDRRRSVGKRVRAISGLRVRGRNARAAIDRLTAEIADRARQTAREACAVAARARRSRRPRARVLAGQLERQLAAAERILAQTDLRLQGQRTIPDRRVSLVDSDARPIRMGNPRRPTEFGYKARIADTAEGFVIADVPQAGNPGDDGLLARAIAKAKDAGMRVDCVLADRGFGTSGGDQALHEHEIKHSVIPRRGHAAPVEATRSWRRRYRFRNGLEGRISQLKRKGLRRTRLRKLPGAQTWVGGITLAHNLQRMAILT